jgi:hypothetical protein
LGLRSANGAGVQRVHRVAGRVLVWDWGFDYLGLGQGDHLEGEALNESIAGRLGFGIWGSDFWVRIEGII